MKKDIENNTEILPKWLKYLLIAGMVLSLILLTRKSGPVKARFPGGTIMIRSIIVLSPHSPLAASSLHSPVVLFFLSDKSVRF